MTEKIRNVILDLEFYSGKDDYSDGDIEEKFLEIAKNETDLEKMLLENTEWSYLYHFSDIRKNILSWYDFNKSASLLEIGAGCGAITGLFCEKVKQVCAIDLSKRRCSINAYRNGQYDNLVIKVGNFEDIDLRGERFDYISLIGVLEYSIYYIHSKEPFLDMLKKCNEYLAPGGVLFVAIENKYGLKYFAGAAEDHYGKEFEGIEGYPNAVNVRTFSRNTLKTLMEKAGFECDFYYPYPDYKMPMQVFSDDYLPSENDINDFSPNYDRSRVMLFDEVLAFRQIIEDGLFQEFSNSFLVVARKNG